MRRWLLVAVCLALLAAGTVVTAQPAPVYRVIVHPRNELTSIDRKTVAQMFLKRTSHWRDGELVRPVDLDAESPVRRRFSEEVLGRSVAAVKSYWQQMIFAGRDVPPPEMDSDDDVTKYVLRHPGAIGYVSPAANLGGAKVITLR